MTTEAPIFATWMDAEGCGPDGVVLTLEGFPRPEVVPALRHPEMHRALHLVFSADPDDSPASPVTDQMIGGLISLHPEAVANLHRQLGAWPEKHGG